MEPSPTAAASDASAPDSGLDFPVVGIGASAGGMAAITTLLQGLPSSPDMAFVVVLHLSPTHESNAAAILQHATRMPVAQVRGRVHIERDHVYVIPPMQDLKMVDGYLELADPDRPRGRHVVIDLFFRALAEAHEERAIGVVLSGTGADGSAGIASLKEHGGLVIAQSPDDAEYDGMPKSAIASGKVDIVLPVAEIPERLMELWRNIRRIEIPDAEVIGVQGHAPASPQAAEAALREVMKILHQRTGHDFKNYKRATVLRRLERRLQVRALPDLVTYRDYLASEPREATALLDDMLIGVTQFFRDRAAFEGLERNVIPKLFESVEDHPVRAWVAGCSTGEEAYSIAMLLAEEAGRTESARKFTVFATDIDEAAILAGRAGVYPTSIAIDVPPARLRTYFAAEPDGYRIHKSLRETVIFAVHNVLRDPPFSRLDLVACRNLLIYLDRSAQQEVLEMFHFALKPGGYLFLGTSETVDAAARLFTPVDKVLRIYRSNPIGRPLRFLQHEPSPAVHAQTGTVPGAASSGRAPTPAEVHRELLEVVATPSVLVTAGHDIIHISASAGTFLRYASGEPSHDLLHSVRDELRQELRTALFQAAQMRTRIDAPPVHMTSAGRAVTVRMTVRPVLHAAWTGELFLVSFDESEALEDGSAAAEGPRSDPMVAQFEREMQRKNQQLRATIEQYEASAEELKASNEELQAMNEELRSATEELETSKEELQSTNEELSTVNHELKTKIDETSEINDDLKNLIAATDIAVVFVDPDMRIKRFTPAAASLFNMIAADVGRSLFDITHKLDYSGLAADARAVFTSLNTITREVKSEDGRVHFARLSPYRTTEDRIGGAVLTFVDVTSLRKAEADADIGDERMALMTSNMAEFAIFTTDREGRLTSWAGNAEQVFGWSAEEVLGLPFEILFTAEDRASGVPAEELRRARATGRTADDRPMLRKDGSTFEASGVMTPLRAGGLQGYAKICRDVTDLRQFEEFRRNQLASAQRGAAEAAAESRQKSEFLAILSHELKHPLNLINVNAQLLTTLPEAQSSPAVMRAGRTIQRTVQGQARIIDDLLDMSRTHTGKLSLNCAPLILTEAIRPCLTWARAEARAKGMQFHAEDLDDSILVEGDQVRIEQIAWNLVSNAIKFSRSGGSITVRVVREGGEALLEVSDTGRGIAPDFLPHVFEMFKQAEAATTRREGGLGIGLALVASLTRLHGGRVDVTSEGPGRGATFRVWLPLHERLEAPPADATAETPKQVLSGARVLLVDDLPETLETFRYLLELEGAIVTTAASGAEALRLTENGEFDLLLSDVGMPQMDGYEMIAEMRSRPRTAALPAIAITGYGRPQDIRRALSTGFQAHIDKPVDLVHMRAVIERVMAGRQRSPGTS